MIGSYRLVDASLIGNFFDAPFLFQNQKFLMNRANWSIWAVKG